MGTIYRVINCYFDYIRLLCIVQCCSFLIETQYPLYDVVALIAKYSRSLPIYFSTDFLVENDIYSCNISAIWRLTLTLYSCVSCLFEHFDIFQETCNKRGSSRYALLHILFFYNRHLFLTVMVHTLLQIWRSMMFSFCHRPIKMCHK